MSKLLFSVLLITTISCTTSDMNYYSDLTDSAIYGIWTDTIGAKNQGIHIQKLTLGTNSSFKYSLEGYGLYKNQSLDEKSFSQEDFGNFVLSTRNIYFVSNQYVYWDFISQTTPDINIEDKEIFESCTYTIVQDTLTLKFKNESNELEMDSILRLIRL